MLNINEDLIYVDFMEMISNKFSVVGWRGQLIVTTSQTLTKDSGMLLITRKMRQSDSGLEIKDRTWLKLKISNAFLGSDLVEWLHTKVEGFQDRKEARKYAVGMLQQGSIKDTVNKSTFSEQCYYTFPPEAKIDKGKNIPGKKAWKVFNLWLFFRNGTIEP